MNKAWRYRKPSVPGPGEVIAPPLGIVTKEVAEQYRAARDAIQGLCTGCGVALVRDPRRFGDYALRTTDGTLHRHLYLWNVYPGSSPL